ncbi:MAG: hypothetical protein K2J99_05435 [Lachnospiraceae bacterium]|nr:hypothetical protein [Lachnospiraceae bacterium]
MNKEMVDMTNREILLAIMGRMDGVESGLGKLTGRIDEVETRLNNLTDKVDAMETNINMEIQAVRTEMEVANKSLKKDIVFLNEKIDRLMILKDVDGIEKMKIRIDVLEQGYQMIREKIG